MNEVRPQLDELLFSSLVASARTTPDLPSLSRFAQHLERDLDAVTAGLTVPFSSGFVEGHVNRIKRGLDLGSGEL
ncbi:hypothetical protein [Streptomyces sviceus]|uniref:hypothetical protein n=1 Tax=Streptomyces sviceus TaxID=285530 RepID=UPI0036B3FBB6